MCPNNHKQSLSVKKNLFKENLEFDEFERKVKSDKWQILDFDRPFTQNPRWDNAVRLEDWKSLLDSPEKDLTKQVEILPSQEVEQ